MITPPACDFSHLFGPGVVVGPMYQDLVDHCLAAFASHYVFDKWQYYSVSHSVETQVLRVQIENRSQHSELLVTKPFHVLNVPIVTALQRSLAPTVASGVEGEIWARVIITGRPPRRGYTTISEREVDVFNSTVNQAPDTVRFSAQK